MCGIVGYTGMKQADLVLVPALQRLEYRGYDSAGLATIHQGRIQLRKKAGKIHNLVQSLQDFPVLGTTGISHTRWATHGPANDVNAHPHLGGSSSIALVHNGVIENYSSLKTFLEDMDYQFKSETDTEVLAHLVSYHFDKISGDMPTVDNLVQAVIAALSLVKGTYGIALVCPLFPNLVIGSRLGSPLVLGLGDGEHFLASDPSALMGFSNRAIYLDDRQICVLTPDSWSILDMKQVQISPVIEALNHEVYFPDKAGFDHFMLKEIHEQAESLENALRGRLDEDEWTSRFGGLNLDSKQLRNIERIILTGCGTSYHAGLVGEYLIEELARIPVEVEYASEFRYRNSPMSGRSIVIGITQSGETADTLAAIRESKLKGIPSLAICNVVGSTIAREADGGVYLHAGQEIGVASTKAFTNQVVVLAMLALHLGRMRHLSAFQGAQVVESLKELPEAVRQVLATEAQVREIAIRYCNSPQILFMGRQYLYPVALEAALKMKEISYIHSEGYPAAEMKHGPIALVDRDTPSVFLISRGLMFNKVMSNLEEVKARGGPVIAVASERILELSRKADEVIVVPKVAEYLQPVVSNIPMQLFAYHMALLRGCDVDKPRNLAKSVTVE